MKKFRLIYNDGSKSLYINAEEFTIKYINLVAIIWREKFKNYQIEFK